ncbi:MAG: hypothetical protein JWM68_2357 [Verrucomicrobiales bacterium]|nr:hypothetical protein [Verrucomicrobiales bacterium]
MTTVDRVTYIVNECRGKRILHLGCTDWPYTEAKLSGGALLHAKINEVAGSLTGVDADEEGVAYFRKIGFSETYVDNVEKFSNALVRDKKYDVIIAGEIIEHLENPGLFLRSVQNVMTTDTVIIITTINAYCFFRFVYYLFKREMVHPDHNFYFSPIVLRKLITRCGLEVVDFRYYPIGKEIRALNPRKMVLLNDIGRLFFPKASDGLIFKARLPKKNS